MKWRVGIFGTEHDQKFLNKIIESQIDDNVELVHYLKPKEFGLNTDVHTHESCIKSASSCDIAFFFINKRYGGLYQGRKFWVEHPDDWTFGLSITHVEYRKVKMNKIPTIVFVHSRTWEEIKNVFLEGNKGKISDKERYDSVRNRWTKNKYYVRNPEIYCFIREASVGIGKKHLYQSWVSVYDDFDLKNNCSNLKEKILERLISLTPDILKELINKQYNALKKELRIGPQITYEFMKDNDCLVEREVQDYKGQNINNPEDKIHRGLNNVMITGDANIGKTFFMIDLFREDVESYNVELERKISIFFSFKNRPKGKFDFERIISNEMLSNQMPPGYPFNFEIFSTIILYIDGIDEGEYITTTELKKFFKKLGSVRNLKFVISLRQEYYEWNSSTFNEIFEGRMTVYRLLKIKAEQGKKLTYRMLKVLGSKTDYRKYDLQKIISNDLLQEPMHCVMAAYILYNKRLNEELHAQNVFDYYIDLQAEHEVGHISGAISKEELYKSWEDSAYIIAWEKTKGNIIGCDNLKKQLINKGINMTTWERHGSLIECNKRYSRFKKESYVDSILSKKIIEYLLNEKGNEDILAIDCYYDRSVFIKNRFNKMGNNDLKKIQKQLFNIAQEHIFEENENDIRITANCIYLLGLMNDLENIDKDKNKRYIMALKDLARNSFLYVDALFQLTRTGDSKAENDLSKELEKESNRKRNLDFHLIYFGVMPPQKLFPPNLIIPQNRKDCTRLLNGMARHYYRKENRDVLRTRIDIKIICDTLEIYHCHYSKKSALKWIERFEKLLLPIEPTDRHLIKLVKDSKNRLKLCNRRIEKLKR